MILPFNPFSGPEHQPFTLDAGQPAVLLIHGFPGTPHEMRPLAECIHGLGWPVHVMLLPGFGPDLDSLADRQVGDWTQAIEVAMGRLHQRHAPVVILGYSLGGALALATALQTRPDGLILFSPFWRFEHILWKLLPVMRLITPRIQPFRLFEPDFTHPEMRKGMAEFMPDLDLDDPAVQEGIRNFAIPMGMLGEIRQAGRLSERAVEDITLPALVFQGWQDQLVPPRQTRQLFQSYAGALRYLELEAGHDLIADTSVSWSQVTTAMGIFLDEFHSRNGAL